MLIVRSILLLAGWFFLAPCGRGQVLDGGAGGREARPPVTGRNAGESEGGADSGADDDLATPTPVKPKAGAAKGRGTGGAAKGKKPEKPDHSPVSLVSWRVVAELPVVPGQSKPGLAGIFAGALSATQAVVAGGTFYEGKGPLEGGQRTFSDSLLVLEQTPGAAGADPAYAWSAPAVKLPRPLAYGASVTLDEGLLMIGGTDGVVCVEDVRLVTWNAAERRPEVAEFPPLPKPLAYLGAGRVGSWVIVAGGTTTPDGRSGADVFGLDLSTRGEAAAFVWQALPSLPVAVHFPIVVGEQGDDGRALHVFGGRDLRPGQGAKVLAEAWSFDPATSAWSASGRITAGGEAGSVPVMAGTAVALEERRLLVLGGDDGVLAEWLEANSQRTGSEEEREAYARLNAAILAAHPGHRRAQLLFEAKSGAWRSAGTFPEATPAVTPAFLWDGAIVLIGGEPAPGQRSAKVWLGALEAE